MPIYEISRDITAKKGDFIYIESRVVKAVIPRNKLVKNMLTLSKGRPPKLSAKQKVAAIKLRNQGYESIRSIAKHFGVSASTISRLK